MQTGQESRAGDLRHPRVSVAELRCRPPPRPALSRSCAPHCWPISCGTCQLPPECPTLCRGTGKGPALPTERPLLGQQPGDARLPRGPYRVQRPLGLWGLLGYTPAVCAPKGPLRGRPPGLEEGGSLPTLNPALPETRDLPRQHLPKETPSSSSEQRKAGPATSPGLSHTLSNRPV